jgi:hypothetical protein
MARPDAAYFWATHQGAELDLLLLRGERRIGVEFKRADVGVVVLFVQIGALYSENPLHDRHLRFRHFRALRISRADWCALAPAAV